LGEVLPTSGLVSFNNTSLTVLNPRIFNQKIGVLRKDQTMFNISIRDYLMLGVASEFIVNDKIIENALKTTLVNDFIQKFPNGLNTEMGHKG
jgi:ATP-binding cassette, subfamily B, bacterial AbcA/BmrA